MLEIVKTKKSISIDGVVYEIKTPNKEQVIKYNKEVHDAGGDVEKILKTSESIFLEVGLPKEIIDSLEIEHFVAISEYLFGAKKK